MTLSLLRLRSALPASAAALSRDEVARHVDAICPAFELIDDRGCDYATLDALMDRVAAALQRDGLRSGDAIALCAATSIGYAAVFLGALRAGVVVAPLAPGSTPDALARMLADAGARLLLCAACCART